MYWPPVSPAVTTSTSDALPMTTPIMLSAARILCAMSALTAIFHVSPGSAFHTASRGGGAARPARAIPHEE